MWLNMNLQELNVSSGSRPFFHVSIPSEPSNGWSLAVIHSSHSSSFPTSRTQILFRLYCSEYLLECSRSHSDSHRVAFDSFPFSCFNLRLWLPLLRPVLQWSHMGWICPRCFYVEFFLLRLLRFTHKDTSEGCLLPCFPVQPAVWQTCAVSYFERVFFC